LYITFEEFPESLYTSAQGIGWNLKELEKRRELQIVFTSPQVLLASLEDPTSPLSITIREKGISRLVLDSVSYFRRLSPGAETLRHTYHALTNSLKRERITALLLSEAAEPTALLEDEAGHLLFVVDGVILMGYVEMGSAMHRALTVLKMRGSDHAKEIRRFEIGPGGLVIKEPFERREGILTGTPRLRVDRNQPPTL
jgi:circadian clock protein KaiC